jgi:hypothetical protein
MDIGRRAKEVIQDRKKKQKNSAQFIEQQSLKRA